jgi:hypothetical protein
LGYHDANYRTPSSQLHDGRGGRVWKYSAIDLLWFFSKQWRPWLWRPYCAAVAVRPSARRSYHHPLQSLRRTLLMPKLPQIAIKPLAGFLLTLCLSGCLRGKPELWIVPENYHGWLRLDYDIQGAPPLPPESGKYVVRMPSSGRLQTSSLYNDSIDENEYCLSRGKNLDRLVFSQALLARGQPTESGFAAQSAFGFFKGTLARKTDACKCVFVGTEAEFRGTHLDCLGWVPGQPAPPPFKRWAPQPPND